jgi:hypothetical protein
MYSTSNASTVGSIYYQQPALVAGFTSDSVLEGYFSTWTRDFTVTKPVYFYSAKHFNPVTNTYLWKIPAGETMDGASIPQVAWSVMGGPYSGSYRLSAAIHDYLCATSGMSRQVSSKIVHELFAEMIYAEGVRGWKHFAMAKAVQLGGPKW